MKNISRNLVSISLALALCGGISGLAFAQEAAEETPEPTRWSAPSVSIGTGTFKIDVQTVFNGFVITTPLKDYEPFITTYDGETKGELVEKDTNIKEDDDEDQAAKISVSAEYDNSDAEGVGYSFGAGGGIKRVNNDEGVFEGYFDSPWGKFFFLEKQLTLRAGGLEELWKAWDDNWDYGNFDGGVQLNYNPNFLKGLNVGISLPVKQDAKKAEYPINNLVVGFKLADLIPYTTISAALKRRVGHYDADYIIPADEAREKADRAVAGVPTAYALALAAQTKAQDALTAATAAYNANPQKATLEAAVTAAQTALTTAQTNLETTPNATTTTAYVNALNAHNTAKEALDKAKEELVKAQADKGKADVAVTAVATDVETALDNAYTAEQKAKLFVPLNESMDLTAALDFNFSPVQIRAEVQILDFNVSDDDLKEVAISDRLDAKFQLHPRFDLSLSKLADLGAFSLETFTVYAWIKSDPTYVSDGNGNTELSIEWAPSYKISESLKASLFFGCYYNVWGGNPEKEKKELEDTYAYNQLGLTIRPALEFSFGPNSGIRLRDQIKIQQTGVSPDRGIENQVQVKFWWGF
jgi:hypothetical protein